MIDNQQHIYRFWSKLGPPTARGCREYTGVISKNGYGIFWWRRTSFYAHRMAYALYYGPAGMDDAVVMHLCDNRKCCEPTHLRLGSVSENNKDRHRKGRTLRGLDLPQTKLTDEQIREIRNKYDAGKSQYDLALEYGIGQPHVSRIVRHLRR